jgi:CRISPR system Cascade subunit CasE
MFFSRITLKRSPDGRGDVRAFPKDGYEAHKLIWMFFADSPHRKRDFLFRFQEEGGGRFYAVSERKPIDPTGWWIVNSKDYDPRLKTGDVLAFMLRVNPVVGRHTEDDHQVRHDVVMDEKKQLEKIQPDRNQWPSFSEIVQRAGEKWLGNRAAQHGFEIVGGRLRVDGYRTHNYRKRAGGRPVSISTLEFTGALAVRDPQAFTRALFCGVGPAKGFGCGLLMVRRV